jgi:hypothetical protein
MLDAHAPRACARRVAGSLTVRLAGARGAIGLVEALREFLEERLGAPQRRIDAQQPRAGQRVPSRRENTGKTTHLCERAIRRVRIERQTHPAG